MVCGRRSVSKVHSIVVWRRVCAARVRMHARALCHAYNVCMCSYCTGLVRADMNGEKGTIADIDPTAKRLVVLLDNVFVNKVTPCARV